MTHIRMPGADLDIPWCEEETPTVQLAGQDLGQAVGRFLSHLDELDWIEPCEPTRMCPVCLALALEAAQGRR